MSLIRIMRAKWTNQTNKWFAGMALCGLLGRKLYSASVNAPEEVLLAADRLCGLLGGYEVGVKFK